MFLKAEVYRPIDLLSDVASKTLACGAAGGRQVLLWHALLFQTFPQFGFAAALFAVPLLALA